MGELRRPLVSVLLATAGYAVTFWAWTLIGPLGPASLQPPSLSQHAIPLVVGTGLLAGSVGRILVGILTDRYGPRLLLPAVSVVSALPVLALAAVRTGAPLVVVAALLGVAATSFPAGAVLVLRSYPPARRGLALSLFGAGMGLAGAAVALQRRLVHIDGDRVVPLIAVALVGYALLAGLLIRGGPATGARRQVPTLRAAAEVLRLPATRYLSAWYAVSFGGTLALGLYLPEYLRQVYRVPSGHAVLLTGACVLVAGLFRPLGGWLCQQRDPVALLRGGFAVTAACGMVVTVQPPLLAVAWPALLCVAASLGLASGVVQGLIGATAPLDQSGAISGTVSAIGTLGALPPPLLLAVGHQVSGSYDIGLTVLAGSALAATAYLHTHRRWMGAALAFPSTEPPPEPATAVVVLSAGQFGGQFVSALGALATQRELLVVSRIPDRAAGQGYALVAGLRRHLPQHHIVALVAGAHPHPHETALIKELLGDGALPVVLTTGDPEPLAALLARATGNGRVLHATRDRSDGVLLRPPGAGAAMAA